MTTDFHQFGLAGPDITVQGRHWLLTIDFEAFRPEDTALWVGAMEQWAELAESYALPFSIFISIEDVVRLRAVYPREYQAFLAGAGALSRMCRFYPHNHCVFDPVTGSRATDPPDIVGKVPGYRKQASLFYDAVHRHRLGIDAWLEQVVCSHDEFLSDLGLARPSPLVFRPGSWDHGSTAEEMSQYLLALRHVGISVHSGVSSGQYGSSNFRVGAPFGSNVFSLPLADAVEVAACVALNCGDPLMSRANAGSAFRLAHQRRLFMRQASGAFVTVLHFDHLFHRRDRSGYRYFAVTDRAVVSARISDFFRRLRALRLLLGLPATTFKELSDRLPRLV